MCNVLVVHMHDGGVGYVQTSQHTLEVFTKPARRDSIFVAWGDHPSPHYARHRGHAWIRRSPLIPSALLYQL